MWCTVAHWLRCCQLGLGISRHIRPTVSDIVHIARIEEWSIKQHVKRLYLIAVAIVKQTQMSTCNVVTHHGLRKEEFTFEMNFTK
jgi:hypothetical protein